MKNNGNKFDNLPKMDNLEKTNHQAYLRRKTGNLNNPVSIILKK